MLSFPLCVNMWVHAMSMSTAESCITHQTEMIKCEAAFGVIPIYETVGKRRKTNPGSHRLMRRWLTCIPEIGCSQNEDQRHTGRQKRLNKKKQWGGTVFPSDCITERFGRSCQEMLSQLGAQFELIWLLSVLVISGHGSTVLWSAPTAVD